MFQNVNKKLFRGLSLAIVLAMLIAPLAFADQISGDADALALQSPHGNSVSATQNGGTTASYDFSAYIRETGNSGDDVFSSSMDSLTVTINRSGDWSSGGTPANFTFSAYDSPQAGIIQITVPCGAQSTTKTMSVILQAGASSNGKTLSPNSITLDYVITAGPDDPSCTPSDTTPPVITPNVVGTLGNNGWYVSDVTVSWSVIDNESAISSSSGCGSTTINYDTDGEILTCTATSAGGTASESVTIKRDATLPTLSPSVSPNPVVLNGSATASANADDATSPGSGLYSSSCDAVDTSSVGLHTVICYAEDNAGNTNTASASYSVNYDFAGFYAPIDMNVVNSAKAGQAIPIKWRLTDANGVGVSDPTSFLSVTASPNEDSCGGAADAIETYAGSSGLQYLGDGYWQYNWKTPKKYAGMCLTMNLNLADGTPHTADFQFK